MIATPSLAAVAVGALVDEVLLTPKPGLVDGRGSGAHADLTVDLLLASAHALHDTFETLATASRGRTIDAHLRAELGAIGRDGERAMLRLSGGVNTHRGAIWAVGLLVSASAQCAEQDACAIAGAAGRIARIPDPHAEPDVARNGARARAAYGVGGAVAQAEQGFPHVVQVGLPRLLAARASGAAEPHARLASLLAIMSTLDDTCVLHRAGPAVLARVQHAAQAVLDAGGVATARGRRAFDALEALLMRHRASPGGAADLFAATLFLDACGRAAP